MNTDYIEFGEMARDVRREMERQREQLVEKVQQTDTVLRVVDMADGMRTKIDDLTAEVEQQRAENDRLRQQLQERDVKISEMSKLTAGMAKKTPEEDLLKALRTYVNRSKRKTSDKRAIAKMATLEIANANGLVLPEDLAAAIESLDDEQAEPKVIKVNGNYNDVHHFHGDIDKLTISSE